MKNKVQNFISEKSLFNKKDKLILGISSGSDSVCLMHILLALGYRFDLAHCNFNLVIRTILYNASEKYLSVAGEGAITIKSDAEGEYEECLVKVKPIFNVLNFQLDEK